MNRTTKIINLIMNFLRDTLGDHTPTTNYYSNHNIQVGDYTYGHPDIYSSERYKVIIGKFCSIGPDVTIYAEGNHRVDIITTYPLFKLNRNENSVESFKGGVIIGNDVWMGHSVIILPGVTIGDGAVLAAGTVVTKDVKDYEIVGGNPARHIKYRFSEEQIRILKETEWWNWPIDKIKKNVPILSSPDVNALKEI